MYGLLWVLTGWGVYKEVEVKNVFFFLKKVKFIKIIKKFFPLDRKASKGNAKNI